MADLIDPTTGSLPKKRRFLGALQHYRGDADIKPTLGGMMAQLEDRPVPIHPPGILNPQDAAIGEGFSKLGLAERAAKEAAGVGELVGNDEVVLSSAVPKMPPKPGNVVADKPGGARSEPAPQDRPAAKSGPTPQQARMQAELDSVAEEITGRESTALQNQRTLARMRSSQELNSGVESLFSDVGGAGATAENAAGASRIRPKLAGVQPPPPPGETGSLYQKIKGYGSQASDTVGGILKDIPGVSRTGRIISRAVKSPLARFAGAGMIPLFEAWDLKNKWQSGRMEPSTDIDPETGEPARDPNTGEPLMVSRGHFEPTPEDLASASEIAKEDADSVLGKSLFSTYKTNTNIPFTDTKIPWARGIIPDMVDMGVGYAVGGPIGLGAIAANKLATAGAEYYKKGVEEDRAEAERKGSEEKYGTVERATATRKKMDASRAIDEKNRARRDFLIRMRDEHGVQFDLGGQ